MGDALHMLTANFLGGVVVPCPAACDVDGNGSTRGVGDALALLTANFLGGVEIPPPHPECGESTLPSDASTPASFERVCTNSISRPPIVASVGDEKALPYIPPPSLSVSQMMAPVSLSILLKPPPA